MKVQECIFLIFAAISLWAEPFAAEFSQGYPLDWPTKTSGGNSRSSPNECDKSSSSSSSSEENCNVYKFTAKKFDGQDIDLEQYTGKVLIIVNYADACGFTYENVCTLSELSKNYRKYGLEILVFPSNDFSQNISRDAAEILATNYPEFEVFSEICVNGRKQHPLYRFLKNKLLNALNSKTIECNFTKFVIDRKGCPVRRFAVTESFEDIEKLVNLLLNEQC